MQQEVEKIDHPETGGHQTSQPMFNLHPLVLVLILVCAGVHVLREHVLSSETDFAVIVRFAFIPLRWSGPYQTDLYTVISGFTYAFLHGGYGHLAINMIWLAAFGSPLANRIGSTRFAVFWAITSLMSAVVFFAFHSTSPAPMVGASGAISAMMAAAARFGFATTRNGRFRRFAGGVLPIAAVLRNRTALTFIAVWFVINLVAGLGLLGNFEDSRIAWEAHIGGFLSGFFLIALLDRPDSPR